MVNFVEAQKPLQHFLVKKAGLRPCTVEIDPETSTAMSFWVPKEKVPPGKKKGEVVPADQGKEKLKAKKRDRPSVVLVHGFAAEGLTTWLFQVGVLAKKYDVYVPDLLFFGGSTTAATDRSPGYQARCLGAALDRLGVERCTVVGFSYGGMVAFKMAEQRPDMVRSLVVSGSVIAMTDSISDATLERLGVKSSAELLLPESVEGLKALQKIATYRKLWFPSKFLKDYLKVMFSNRKQREELLEGLVISNKDARVPPLQQTILLLWGANDNIFNIHLAKTMKEQLGEKTTLQAIEKAGHLMHLERPCVYNRQLMKFLAAVNAGGSQD